MKTLTRRRARPSRVPGPTASLSGHWLVVRGAAHNNLKNIDVAVPLGRFVCVTGVSGSGKSSLVNDILYARLALDLNGAEDVAPGKHRAIEGAEHLDKVIAVDQSPIGRTPRSNPATYIKVFDLIRDLYASLPDAKVRGYKPGRFSFNVKGEGLFGANVAGRCEACEGNGANRIEMDFLADVWVTCPVCNGQRFNRETLQIHFRGKSIADVLDMDVQQALEHFANVPRIAAMLQTLHDVGLDYVKLGQPSPTLSGGEAQRIKLARQLVRLPAGRTLYLLDEPTTGLHFEDIRRLLEVLHRFVDAGHSVVVIEHNLDVIKTADWVIDLGPEGGEAGGVIVVEGTPEDVAADKRSYTGHALKRVLSGGHQATIEKGSRRAMSRAAPRSRLVTPSIRVVGAREHNLKNVSVDIPRNAVTVCSGVSGSGKSSFALDTVYAEGQRRYLESLSAYARQFLGRFEKPDVDSITGLSPAIAIDQKGAARSPRSTVGTVTEIYDYMRVLWARLGQPYCPDCDEPVRTMTSDEIVEAVMSDLNERRALICAPIHREASSEYRVASSERVGESWSGLLERYRESGYRRVRIDGDIVSLEQGVPAKVDRAGVVEIVVDRLTVRGRDRSRIADSVEHALSVGDGTVVVVAIPPQAKNNEDEDNSLLATRYSLLPPEVRRFSQHRACGQCGREFEEVTPHHLSFNNRLGWCTTCEGLGSQRGTSPANIAINTDRSLLDGALSGWQRLDKNALLRSIVLSVAKHIGIDPGKPWNKLPEPHRQALLFGTGTTLIPVSRKAADGADRPFRVQFKGFFPSVDEATRISWQYRDRLEELVTDVACQGCGGSRLRPESRAVKLGGRTISDICGQNLAEVLAFFRGFSRQLDRRSRAIAGELLKEITSRLQFLVDIGLEYLTLGRASPTLSGGETQRIRLAGQLGSGLTGVLYVLDEPTIGLHPRDNARLIASLRRLRDLGNTLLMVEHDREVIESADHLLDFGPGAGREGGAVVASGAPARLRKKPQSLTGRYLAGQDAILVPTNRRPVKRPIRSKSDDRWLTVVGARHNNLKNLDVAIPLGRFVTVTGVSGSGKSSLITDILYPALAQRIHRARTTPGAHKQIRGVELVDKVINVDQSPIGQSPSSSPCTYTGVFDLIRELFAKLPESRVRGYNANRFSFNRPGGRCEECDGLGQVCYEMHFLPDVWVECETCRGNRYNEETLDVRYKGKNVADVLRMRVADALELFEGIPRIHTLLKTLDDVGLGYIQLGQSAPTLSGGEAQRVKLAAELGRPSTGKTLYILDEPTTGLHFADLRRLLDVLHCLVEQGNSVVCIEHNLEVIKTADWVIDLGPEAGDAGGEIVVQGTPETAAACASSHTGRVLALILAAGPHGPRKEPRASVRAAQGTPLEHGEPRGQKPAVPFDFTSDVKMPWQRDGRRWHIHDRVSRRGEQIEWDGAALEFIVNEIERLGGKRLHPTDWNDRARVEIRARPPNGCPADAISWFMHALTGSRWLLDLSFRVPTRTFASSVLAARLKLKPLDDRDDLPVYGQSQRVKIRQHSSELDQVRLWVHDIKEITTPAFRQFLKTAVQKHLTYVQEVARHSARSQPWKADGRAWHLSQKSIAPGRAPLWPSVALVELLGRIGRLVQGAVPDWSRKTAVLVHDRKGNVVLRLVTNQAQGIRVEVTTEPGEFTPTVLERLGEDPKITTVDVSAEISFWVRNVNEMDQPTFQALLRAAKAPRTIRD